MAFRYLPNNNRYFTSTWRRIKKKCKEAWALQGNCHSTQGTSKGLWFLLVLDSPPSLSTVAECVYVNTIL